MSKETDLLRRAAELLEHASMLLPGMQDTDLVRKRNACKPTAASLIALADEWERAKPVAVRQWHDEFKCWNYDDIEDVLPSCKGERLYTHPAPEVTRDAERYRWLRARIPGSTYRIMGVIYSEGRAGVDAAIDAAMQEPKP